MKKTKPRKVKPTANVGSSPTFIAQNSNAAIPEPIVAMLKHPVKRARMKQICDTFNSNPYWKQMMTSDDTPLIFVGTRTATVNGKTGNMSLGMIEQLLEAF